MKKDQRLSTTLRASLFLFISKVIDFDYQLVYFSARVVVGVFLVVIGLAKPIGIVDGASF